MSDSAKPTLHPRPDRKRDAWHSLNGDWDLFFDDTGSYDFSRVTRDDPFAKVIHVPFAYQSELSGIHDTRYHPLIWHRKRFDRPDGFAGDRVLLHFGAVDYQATVWLNNKLVGMHRGGYVPFCFDVTSSLQDRDNTLIVKAVDLNSTEQPRGKQTWSTPAEVWYTPVSGIWQSVWIESVGQTYIDDLRIQAEPESGRIRLSIFSSESGRGNRVAVRVREGSAVVAAEEREQFFPATEITLTIDRPALWSPATPVLYEIDVDLIDVAGKLLDRVSSYTAFRSVGIKDGRVLLNGKPYFFNLVLDQGFWRDGLYTPPSEQALRDDIELAKSMGFNGCRKHMKVENPQFLYWADRLGFLVWEEFPAAFVFTAAAREQLLSEWLAAVRRDLGHPSIVAWVPYNESWGIQNVGTDPEVQAWVKEIYLATRSIDSTRLIIDNDGWEHVRSDIISYHDYSETTEQLSRGFSAVQAGAVVPGSSRRPMADGVSVGSNPIMLTEYGGIALVDGAPDGDQWGYARVETSPDSFKSRLTSNIDAVSSMDGLAGAVYTQLTDTEQEVNGLLTADRKSKIPIAEIRQLFSRLTNQNGDA